MNLNNHRETFLYQKYFLLCTKENTFDGMRKVLPWRIKLLELCKIMDFTRAQLQKIVDSDPSFPMPIKDFQSRRSGVYFDSEQIEMWLQKNYELNDLLIS